MKAFLGHLSIASPGHESPTARQETPACQKSQLQQFYTTKIALFLKHVFIISQSTLHKVSGETETKSMSPAVSNPPAWTMGSYNLQASESF